MYPAGRSEMSRVARRAAALAPAPVVTVAGIDAADCLADEPPLLQLAIAGSTSATAAKRALRRFTVVSLRRSALRTRRRLFAIRGLAGRQRGQARGRGTAKRPFRGIP